MVQTTVRASPVTQIHTKMSTLLATLAAPALVQDIMLLARASERHARVRGARPCKMCPRLVQSFTQFFIFCVCNKQPKHHVSHVALTHIHPLPDNLHVKHAPNTAIAQALEQVTLPALTLTQAKAQTHKPPPPQQQH